MGAKKQIYDMILNFAKADERIRMVTLEGSRINLNILPDDFQNYDITFLFRIYRALSQMMNDLIYLVKADYAKNGEYGVIAGGGKRTFLVLLLLDLIDEYFTWDKVVKLLQGKDHRIAQTPIPTDVYYHIQRPTALAFNGCRHRI
ncbi:aminoglycoside 6-adenylyltransferase [Limosilactobacillus caccae]|uniref:aminoglycoside 6-adenylyltransferase n=1 Tax=Limosilactobacillus caccae TaxID=1926284 RepID=UPI000970DA26|nr:aminoglycoside 6-adenylyltransferase [Limosilactobacillus caccae]